ncbi:MAG: ribonuclease R family protein [Acidobacteriaceae bacterium]
MQRSANGKAGYKQLIRELGLGGGQQRRLLREQLARLVASGELTLSDDRMWSIPPPEPSAPPSAEPSPYTLHPSRGDRSDRSDRSDRPASRTAAVRSGRDRLLSGRLDLHREGYGFVRLDRSTEQDPDRQQDRRQAAGASDDIFIPPNALQGAMQGDLVLVEPEPPGRDKRRSGRILRVLTRRNPTIVGLFHYQDLALQGRRQELLRNNFVTPWDERLGGPILIADGDQALPASSDAMPGTAASPHRLLSEEARRVLEAAETTDPLHPLEGLVVDVEILSFPTSGHPARGRVLEVLGPPDGFGVDVEIVIRKHQIPHTFPPQVLQEAEARALEAASALDVALPNSTVMDPELLSAREDFRSLPIVTIDGETAKDFDDAVLVRHLPNGNDELQVHIADVSWYVQPGTALDTEARFRGTSVYFPDRAIPMLPHALSSGICSLLPGQDRLVLSCIMEIDPEGEIVGYRLAEGIIRSLRRMTYTSVQQCLNAAGPPNQIAPDQPDASAPQPTGATRIAASHTNVHQPQPSAEDIAERERIALEHPELPSAFDAMLQLALRLNAKRVRRGSIDFDLPEPVVEFDPDGNMKAIVRSERGWAHRLIEEFMLSANECVAHWLEGRGLNRAGVPSLYRIHETPDPKKIVEFEETAAAFGHSLGIGSLPVRTITLKADRRELRQRSAQGKNSARPHTHEIPSSIPVTPQMYQDLLRRIRATPEERILSYLMLRSLKQARYAEKNEGHFALASPCYTHFTSPIRRYPDLVVHRLVRAMLHHGTDPRGAPIRSDDWQPWQAAWKTRTTAAPAARASMREQTNAQILLAPGPITVEELNDIAIESSQAERRAAEAERELIEWKKMKFMADKIGDDFPAVILSVTRYGFFVELDDLFIEGMVPIGSLVGDHYTYRDTDRTLVGARTGHVFTIGQPVQVLLDRIDRQQRRLQFALLPGTEPRMQTAAQGRGGKSEAKKAKAREKAKQKTKARKTSARAKPGKGR